MIGAFYESKAPQLGKQSKIGLFFLGFGLKPPNILEKKNKNVHVPKMQHNALFIFLSTYTIY